MTRMLMVTDVQEIIKRHQAQIITSLKDPDIRLNLILCINPKLMRIFVTIVGLFVINCESLACYVYASLLQMWIEDYWLNFLYVDIC